MLQHLCSFYDGYHIGRSLVDDVDHHLNKVKIGAQHYSRETIRMKLVPDKRDGTLLFAEAKENFIDLLLSFLAYPIGSVMKQLGGQSGGACIDNIYQSIESLIASSCFKKNECTEKLPNSKLPPPFSFMEKLM